MWIRFVEVLVVNQCSFHKSVNVQYSLTMILEMQERLIEPNVEKKKILWDKKKRLDVFNYSYKPRALLQSISTRLASFLKLINVSDTYPFSCWETRTLLLRRWFNARIVDRLYNEELKLKRVWLNLLLCPRSFILILNAKELSFYSEINLFRISLSLLFETDKIYVVNRYRRDCKITQFYWTY